MNRLTRALGGLLLAAALAACGGGGGSAGTPSTGGTTSTPTTGTTTGTTTPTTPGTGTTTVAATPAAMEVFTSSAELSTASNSSITFNVAVKDASNQAIPSQPVSFSASSGNLTGSLPVPSTGAAGQPITTVSLSPGADRSNRNITVTLVAGSVTQQITIPVTGTALSAAGASFVLIGATTTFTVKALDSAGQPVTNASLTVSSALGNTITPSSLTTNSQGAASFVYTGTRAGNDTITIQGLGTNTTAPITVSADQFSFEAPAANASVAVGAAQAVTVRYLIAGVPQVGKAVTFSTTRGAVATAVVATDADGRASTTVSSTSSGPANIVAQTATAQVTLPVLFVATAPSTLVLQANPGALPPNAAGSTANQAALQATVRDASGNPVKGVTVNFTAVTDPSNGTISPGTATTDAAGSAVAQFTSGPLTTANNGVIMRATVQGTAISGTASLTVNAQALFITIGTGNDISNLDPTTYQKQFSVYVTDANGAPAANRSVTLSAYPTTYGKGTLVYDDVTAKQWVYASFTSCLNEDVNRDGILQAEEDDAVAGTGRGNGNGKLDPGLPVVVSPATVTTDNTGRATFFLQYGENFAPWLNAQIVARASVGGTESVKLHEYFLRGLSSDFTNKDVAPAGAVSPFGVVANCRNPN